jgi:hypothetical protein
MNWRSSLNMLVVLGSAGAATPSWAQAPGPPPPAPTPSPLGSIQPYAHDGLFVRAIGGLTLFSTTAEDDFDEVSISGDGMGLSLAIGGAISPRVVVFGEIYWAFATGPTIDINGAKFKASGDVSLGVAGIGPGIAYYFPSNVYASGTLAISKLRGDDDGQDFAESDIGFGLVGGVGKEWWVAPQLGLGVAGQVYLGSIPDGTVDVSWSTTAITIGVTGSYN